MFLLTNPELTVSILDPVADVARLGSRYVTGGYIWQVTDSQAGELLSGPEYPREPNTFDGQGAPDFFIRALGAEDAPLGGEVGCIGVGRVRRTTLEPFDVRFNREVIEFVRWDVASAPGSLLMRTRAEFRDWAYALEREVTLVGRAVQSRTAITNLGRTPLPVRWFPHPFFPLTADGLLCRFSLPFSLAENPGYALDGDGFIRRKAGHDWVKGWYQPVTIEKNGQRFSAIQKHPGVGQVAVEADFHPGFLPIWGNDRTFSFEPYVEREFHPGQGAAWHITYNF